MFFKYYYGRNNSLINEPFNTSQNCFSSKDRHSKLRNVDLEHGHVYIVKYHNTNYLQNDESNTNIAYQKYVLYVLNVKWQLYTHIGNNTIIK